MSMTTATEARIWYCTEYVTWPAPEIGQWDRYKGKTTPTCWKEFPSKEARKAHYLEDHADWLDSMTERARLEFLGEDTSHLPPREERRPAPVGSVPEPESDGGYHPPTGRKVDNAPSPEQLDLIERLGKQKQQETNEVKTKAEASIEIERLMAFPDKGLKLNRYAGSCTECHTRVEAEAGFVRQLDGAWVTAHKPGSCPEAKEVVSVEDGCYAVTAEAGHTSFYKVTNGRKPGIVFVDLLIGGGTGGKLEKQKVPFQQVDGVLAKIAEDPTGASERFFLEAAACRRCGRGLSLEKSRKDGYGSECAKYVD